MGRHNSLLLMCSFGVLLACSSFVVITSIFSQLGFGAFSFLRFEKVSELYFVGDVMLARDVESTLDMHGAAYPYQRLPDVPKTAYGVANFESSMNEPHTKTPNFTFAFSTKAAYAKELITQGFTYISLANNHSYDYGESGYQFARETLIAAGAKVFGNRQLDSEESIEFVDVSGIRIALVGLYAVDVVPLKEEIDVVMGTASAHSDMQIVYVHWGTEYEVVHSNSQEELAHTLIDAGADAIVGHHPHVVQDIGVYAGKPIFYSLGNFIFDQYFSSEVMDGLTLSLGVDRGSQVWELVPVTSRDSRVQPRLMTEEESSEFLQALSERSQEEVKSEILKGGLEFSF